MIHGSVMIAGLSYRLIEDSNMVEQVGVKNEVIPWKERLFSRPWRPFKGFRLVPIYEPRKNVFRDDENMLIIGHPVVIQELIRQIKNV